MWCGDEEGNMTPRFQYRDPLIGILDYIAEVRLYVCAS